MSVLCISDLHVSKDPIRIVTVLNYLDYIINYCKEHKEIKSVINLGDTSTQIALDINNMNAYNPTTQAFMNRSVTGNYDNFVLNVGKNTISWSGTITQIAISNYSRWI